jgi:glutamate-ammonia-ligase adenylyltransferase
MGKLGSGEMTATSDLDLMFLYGYDEESPVSDGAQALEPERYFARLASRFLSYLTAATRRGTLYEVDMRLRPSGRQGPLASKLSAFRIYQRQSAATWERMALTRARPVAGDDDFVVKAEAEIESALRLPAARDIHQDVVAMRALIEREKPPHGDWDLKLLPGGLIDVEFIAQTLVLQNTASMPALVGPATATTLDRAIVLGLVERDQGRVLAEAHRLFSGVTQVVRLALGDEADPGQAGEPVKRRIAAVAQLPDLAALAAEIASTRQAVREIFKALLVDA